MKTGKKPSYNQRKLIESYGLDAHDWLVSKDTSTQMVLVHRHLDGVVRTIPKNT
jgi:hypothetical protein